MLGKGSAMKTINEIVQWLAIALLAIVTTMPVTIGVWKSEVYQLDGLQGEVDSLKLQLNDAMNKESSSLELAVVRQSLQKLEAKLDLTAGSYSRTKYAALIALGLSTILAATCIYLFVRIQKMSCLGVKASVTDISKRAA
jgi:hypothetical protein